MSSWVPGQRLNCVAHGLGGGAARSQGFLRAVQRLPTGAADKQAGCVPHSRRQDSTVRSTPLGRNLALTPPPSSRAPREVSTTSPGKQQNEVSFSQLLGALVMRR